METKDIKEAIEPVIKEFKDTITKSVDDAKKEAKDSATALEDKIKAMGKQVDTIEAKSKQTGLMPLMANKSFGQEVEEKLTANKDQLSKGQKFTIEFDRKAVGNMSSSGSLTGSYFVAPDVKPGIVLRPYEDVHMRDIFPVGTTTSNVVRHVRDNGGEGGPAMVAEGATKPQMDRDLSIEDANVRKVATYLRVPEEMMEDIPYITSFLTNIGVQEVLAVEDYQILYGDGTGQNLSGLFTNATAFAAPATAIVASPNRFDVLRAARLVIRRAKRRASFALVSPLDYFLMTSAKDSTGNYILQGGGNGLIPSLDGVPVIENTNVADNDFLVGDRYAAEIDFRSNVNARFYEQDQDNAIKNMVTIVIEERLALPIYYTNGLVKGTFTAAITDLTS